jgi:sulfite exporter TauE/SafE
VCVYAGSATPRGLRNLPAHLAYNGGRLVSYVGLGAVAGAIGARVDDLGRFAGLGRGAAVLAGTLMVAWALGIIAAAFGVRVPGTLAPEWAKRRLGAALSAMRTRPPVARAAVTGLLTTLLPCGWLYTFVVTAGGTGSALDGAGVMIAFWLGTVPILLGLGLGAQRLLGPVARRLPLASAAMVLVLGVLSIVGRVHPPGMHMAGHAMPAATADSAHVAR